MRLTSIAIALTLTSSVSATAQTRDADATALRATVDAVRTTGTTLVDWILAQPGADRTFMDRVSAVATFDWGSCPPITLEQARALIGEESGAKLRELDGWGKPLEYCLRTERPGTDSYSVGVRSAGRDGGFQATPYVPSGFDPSQPDHDVVWIDGVFVTAPVSGR
jgi:hypothetical protein